MRRSLGDLGITRRYAPLLIWVTSLKLYEQKHIPHCGIKMWQNNLEIGWTDLPFFSTYLQKKKSPPHGISLVLCMHPSYLKVQSGVRSSLNLCRKYFWIWRELSTSITQSTEINPDRRKGTNSRTSSLSMSSLCSKILHEQLFNFPFRCSLNVKFQWYFLSIALFLEGNKQKPEAAWWLEIFLKNSIGRWWRNIWSWVVDSEY